VGWTRRSSSDKLCGTNSFLEGGLEADTKGVHYYPGNEVLEEAFEELVLETLNSSPVVDGDGT
jgi:hypothetical protein